MEVWFYILVYGGFRRYICTHPYACAGNLFFLSVLVKGKIMLGGLMVIVSILFYVFIVRVYRTRLLFQCLCYLYDRGLKLPSVQFIGRGYVRRNTSDSRKIAHMNYNIVKDKNCSLKRSTMTRVKSVSKHSSRDKNERIQISSVSIDNILHIEIYSFFHEECHLAFHKSRRTSSSV